MPLKTVLSIVAIMIKIGLSDLTYLKETPHKQMFAINISLSGDFRAVFPQHKNPLVQKYASNW